MSTATTQEDREWAEEFVRRVTTHQDLARQQRFETTHAWFNNTDAKFISGAILPAYLFEKTMSPQQIKMILREKLEYIEHFIRFRLQDGYSKTVSSRDKLIVTSMEAQVWNAFRQHLVKQRKPISHSTRRMSMRI